MILHSHYTLHADHAEEHNELRVEFGTLLSVILAVYIHD
jgi:hypothetical protein